MMVSRRRLIRRPRWPQAAGAWVMDSGGFTELEMHGGWQTSSAEYADTVAHYADQIGGMEWAAPQDWMCEPKMIERTGLSVREHQERTVANFVELSATGLPFIPVLQGWVLEDYLACIELYRQAGVNLYAQPIVGMGTVCRRQDTDEIGVITDALAGRGLRLHAFGVKTLGLRRIGHALTSADSLAWSYNARRNPPLATCRHKSCANCRHWAMAWRERALQSVRSV